MVFGFVGNHVIRWRGDLRETAHPVLRITQPAEWCAARGRLREARRTEGSAHMSEAPHGGHDSRPGENPQASVGQRARGTADARECEQYGPGLGA